MRALALLESFAQKFRCFGVCFSDGFAPTAANRSKLLDLRRRWLVTQASLKNLCEG